MKKTFIINLFIAGTFCLVLFGMMQKGEVEKLKSKYKNLQRENQQLESENDSLRKRLTTPHSKDSSELIVP